MSISGKRFTQYILQWADDHPRPLPWKETRDPYKIWISEVILQQTQVSQGLSYYTAFLQRYPTVKHLAEASENQVLRLWQGLGYNSRARNLHAAARSIMSDHGGVFPNTYEGILSLKGIGEYTAAAIGSFAFDLPVPVLDSNVMRVLSRVYGITEDISKPDTRKAMYVLLHKMIKDVSSAEFNQAIMNFGALQCTPRNPECHKCILSKFCVAYNDDLVKELPVKPEKKKRRIRAFHYFMIYDTKGMILHQRTAKDIWRQMYEFPMIEILAKRSLSGRDQKKFLEKFQVLHTTEVKVTQTLTQILTHQQLQCVFYLVKVRNANVSSLPPDCSFERYEKLKNFALPKVIRSFLTGNSLHLIKHPTGAFS